MGSLPIAILRRRRSKSTSQRYERCMPTLEKCRVMTIKRCMKLERSIRRHGKTWNNLNLNFLVQNQMRASQQTTYLTCVTCGKTFTQILQRKIRTRRNSTVHLNSKLTSLSQHFISITIRGFKSDNEAVPACYVINKKSLVIIVVGVHHFPVHFSIKEMPSIEYSTMVTFESFIIEIDNTLWQILPSWYSDSKCFVSLAGINSELYNNLKRWQRQKAQRLYVSCVYWLVWIIYTYELCTCTIGQLA